MTNKLNDIYIATFSGNAEEVAKKYGFGLELNDLCISENLEPEKRDWVIKRMEGELERAGSNCRRNIMHGPFTELTPSAIDKRAIELMRERYLASLEICAHMGIKDLVLHDGYIPLIYHKSWHLKRSVSFWKDFAREVLFDRDAFDGIRIYIENVFDDEPDLLTDIVHEVNLELASELGLKEGEERYLICLDIGHANAMSSNIVSSRNASKGLSKPASKDDSQGISKLASKDDSQEVSKRTSKDDSQDATENIIHWIKRMGPLIGHLHLHSNDGSGDQHDDVDKGSFDIDSVLQAVGDYLRDDVTMTIESRQADPSAEYLYNYFSEKVNR